MDDIAARARLAYAQGWVESGGPMTGRVRAGCAAAVAVATGHADQPGILEATLNIGKLEGTWAAIFADREHVHHHHGRQITAAYRDLLGATLDVRAEVRRFRRSLNTPGGLAQHADARTAATAASIRLVHQAADTSHPAYRVALAAITDAMGAAEQAGRDAATRLMGPREAAPPPSGSGRDNDTAAAATLGAFIRGTTTDVGNDLVVLDVGGATEDEMVAAIDEDTSGDGERASGLIGDQAISSGYGGGMLATFTRAALAQVNFVTAGDTKVCQRCSELEAGNPYTLFTVPSLGQHPSCRCVYDY